jgi:RNA polymerase-binding transcription factor DksA
MLNPACAPGPSTRIDPRTQGLNRRARAPARQAAVGNASATDRCCRSSAGWTRRSSPGPASAAPLTVEQGEGVKSSNPLPRAASWTQRRSNPLAARLPTLRATLEHERDFRRDQLAQLDPHERALSAVDQPVDGFPRAESALHEVDALIAAGARRALNDIELALARMHAGRYGYCRTCGLGMPLVVARGDPQDHVVPGLPGTDRTTGKTRPGRSQRRSRSAGRVSPRGTGQAAAATMSCH